MQKDSKYMYLVGLPFVLLAIGLSIFFHEKNLKNYLDYSQVTSILVTDGRNGKQMNIEDKGELTKVLDYMDYITFRRKLAPPWTDYTYKIDFMEGDQCVVTLVFAEDISKINYTNHSYFNSNKLSLDEFLHNLTLSTFTK